jgi:hypothetical protein
MTPGRGECATQIGCSFVHLIGPSGGDESGDVNLPAVLLEALPYLPIIGTLTI